MDILNTEVVTAYGRRLVISRWLVNFGKKEIGIGIQKKIFVLRFAIPNIHNGMNCVWPFSLYLSGCCWIFICVWLPLLVTWSFVLWRTDSVSNPWFTLHFHFRITTMSNYPAILRFHINVVLCVVCHLLRTYTDTLNAFVLCEI